MTLRKLALATALTGATALTAHAEEYMEKGHTFLDVDGTEYTATVTPDSNVYTVEGRRAVDVEAAGPSQEGANEDLAPNEPVDTAQTEVENVLNTARNGAVVSTVDGVTVGTVAYVSSEGPGADLVVVDVSENMDYGVDLVGFPASTLKVNVEDQGLEYSGREPDLRDDVIYRISG